MKAKLSYHSAAWAGIVLLSAAGSAHAGDDIQVYTVPKEHPPVQLARAQTPDAAPNIPVNAAPVTWSTPDGWRELPRDTIRLGHLLVSAPDGGKAEVTITSFPGTVGTELANVNRWRAELQLPPIGESEISSEPVSVDNCNGKLFDIAGSAARTLVAMVPRNGNTWFIKLRGDSAAVASGRPAFAQFLKSVRFGSDAGQQAAAPIPAGAPDPHAGLAGFPNAPGNSVVSGVPEWSVPPAWQETGPRNMVLDSFSVGGAADGKAEVTVSLLHGGGGGVLANVNRWRGQLGQPPLDAGQLDGVTESVQTAGGAATIVDFLGADAKTGQPARMVAAIVPHGDNTWFYKLTGDGKVVGKQKDAFVNFLKTVQYP